MTVQELIDELARGVREELWTPDSIAIVNGNHVPELRTFSDEGTLARVVFLEPGDVFDNEPT